MCRKVCVEEIHYFVFSVSSPLAVGTSSYKQSLPDWLQVGIDIQDSRNALPFLLLVQDILDYPYLGASLCHKGETPLNLAGEWYK